VVEVRSSGRGRNHHLVTSRNTCARLFPRFIAPKKIELGVPPHTADGANIPIMPYQHIAITRSVGKRERKILDHADAMLSDVYSMLEMHPLPPGKVGGCNFSALLVLVCLLDALAAHIYHPTRSFRQWKRRGVQFKRMQKMTLDLMPWHESWSPDKATFVQHLYYEFRNPLAHEAGRDPKKRIKARPRGWQESMVAMWGEVKPVDISQVDTWTNWPEEWPIFEAYSGVVRSKTGKPFRYRLTVVALYWAVKDIVRQLSK
jgi:hypothetical protein